MFSLASDMAVCFCIQYSFTVSIAGYFDPGFLRLLGVKRCDGKWREGAAAAEGDLNRLFGAPADGELHLAVAAAAQS